MPEGTGSLSPLPASKLATETYNWDGDDYDRTPPMQPRVVNYKPTPSPEFVPQGGKHMSPEPGASSSRKRGSKRRRRTKASQGDAVLIGYMGDHNRPEVAAQAGEEALNSASEASQSEPEDECSSRISENGDFAGGMKQDDPMNQNQRTPSVFGSSDETGHHVQSPLPSLSTQDLLPRPRDVARFDATKSRPGNDGSGEYLYPKSNGLYQTSAGASVTEFTSTMPTSQPSSRPSQELRRRSSGTSTLRKFAMPASEASRTETLPAIQNAQNSPSSLSATSPKEQQTLPPLHALVGDLVDGYPINDHTRRPNGLSPGQSPYNSVNESGRSPSLGPLSSRSGQFSPRYSSMQFRSLAHGDPPPRGPYRRNQNAAILTPPGNIGASPYYPNGRTLPGEEMPMASAESYQDPRSYGTEISPTADRVSLESTRPVLPPPPGTLPAMTGTFKCEHHDCKAPPFQTQYLLK